MQQPNRLTEARRGSSLAVRYEAETDTPSDDGITTAEVRNCSRTHNGVLLSPDRDSMAQSDIEEVARKKAGG